MQQQLCEIFGEFDERQIKIIDAQIDRLVHDLYGLTEEIKDGENEWVKSKNCKVKEEDMVYTT